MSLFRYGLDYVQMAIQRLIGFWEKRKFKEILAILRRQNPDRIIINESAIIHITTPMDPIKQFSCFLDWQNWT